MARYSIQVSATAEKQLRKIDGVDQLRIIRAIKKLAEEPLPRGCRKLAGYEQVWRIRVGTYRIIYSIYRKEIIIIILKIGQRRDIYR
jgi:mRNA interferase RelE/StbE